MSHHDHHHHDQHNKFHGHAHPHHHCCCEPLRVGRAAPAFEMEAVLAQGEGMERFGKVSLQQNMDAGKWTVLYFYPRDFTFVCPTEIKRFDSLYSKFAEKNAEVIACSTDSPYTHLKWQETDLGRLKHPHASDPTLAVARAYTVLDREEGLALRGTFIINPKGVLMSYSINASGVGRSVDEVLRLLEACQNAAEGKLMPCEWRPGDKTL